jgi:hypothetical protein
MVRVTKKDYEEYLNDLGDDMGDTNPELKMNGGRMPNRSKYGTWMRANDPIAFNVGFGEHEMFMMTKKKTIGRFGAKKTTKKPKETVRTVHNPVTGRDYVIRTRSSAYPGAGQIRGLWSKDKEKK